MSLLQSFSSWGQSSMCHQHSLHSRHVLLHLSGAQFPYLCNEGVETKALQICATFTTFIFGKQLVFLRTMFRLSISTLLHHARALKRKQNAFHIFSGVGDALPGARRVCLAVVVAGSCSLGLGSWQRWGGSSGYWKEPLCVSR